MKKQSGNANTMPPTVTLDRPITDLAPTVLDIEASGLGRSSYPIEVGYVLPDGHAYCTLVQPEQDWTHWDDSAAALHRITRELLNERGLRAREVATLLNTQLAGQTVYSDGWANDFTWLNVLYEAAGMSPRFKLENLRSLLRRRRGRPMACRQSPDRQRARHPAAQGEFGCALDPAHPATHQGGLIPSLFGAPPPRAAAA